MPELITKYPDVALKILKDAHIDCGTGASQTILKSCPKSQFCALPSGELCVYGVQQISQATQLNPLNFVLTSSAIVPLSALMIIVFLLGFLCGIRFKI